MIGRLTVISALASGTPSSMNRPVMVPTGNEFHDDRLFSSPRTVAVPASFAGMEDRDLAVSGFSVPTQSLPAACR